MFSFFHLLFWDALGGVALLALVLVVVSVLSQNMLLSLAGSLLG